MKIMIIRFAGATGLAPEFLGTISNLTTSQVCFLIIGWYLVTSVTKCLFQGRDASFACSVRNLGGYRVFQNHHIFTLRNNFSSYSCTSPFHVLWCQNLMLHSGTDCVQNDLQFHLFPRVFAQRTNILEKWKNGNPKDFQPYFILENVKSERFSVETLFISLQSCLLSTRVLITNTVHYFCGPTQTS